MVNTFVPTDSQEAQCPECGAVIRVAGRRRRVQCPKCREIVTLVIPEPEKRVPKPSPPVAAGPASEPAAKAGADPARLEAIEARIEALENAKHKAPSSSIEAIESRVQPIESAKLEVQSAKLRAQSSKLEALEARLAVMEEGMQAASAGDAPSPPEKGPPDPEGAPTLSGPKDAPARSDPAESRRETAESRPEPAGTQPVFGQAVRIASPDELENPIPGLPPLSRIAKAATVPPGRFRWLAPDESHTPGISPAQEDVLLHNLRTIPRQQITIRTITGNPFSLLCAESFRGIFERAGWTVHGVEEIPRTLPEPGLSLAVASLPVEREAAATYLALKAAGFSPAIVLDTALASGASEDAAPLTLTLGPAKTA